MTRDTAMRLVIIVLTGVVAVGMAGCASSKAPTGSRLAPPAGAHVSAPEESQSSPALVLPTSLGQAARTGARAAATHFDVIYASSNFAASWEMLASSTQREIPRTVWVAVHDECATTVASARVVVKSVTIFGNSAIVSAVITATGSAEAAEEIFDYGAGGWHYMPDDPSIYQHSSIQADVTAAKAAGVCMSGKYF
jgi:hypothetical protein